VTIRSQQRIPEVSGQRCPTPDPADDGIYLAVGQVLDAAFVDQSIERLLSVGRIETGRLDQGGSVRGAMPSQPEEQLSLRIREIQKVWQVKVAAGCH
jgi:hypothetical protein